MLAASGSQVLALDESPIGHAVSRGGAPVLLKTRAPAL